MTAKRAPGWWYPWIFVAGMATVVCVNLVLAYFAVSTWTGLETKNYYDRGLRYNDTIAAAQDQEARGWNMVFTGAPTTVAGEDGATLAVSFKDRTGQPIDDLTVEALLIRPTVQGFDAAFALRHQGNGVYAGQVLFPLPGQWDARIHARRRGETFQASRRLFVN
jgi:nitrogen fixation protein FixH